MNTDFSITERNGVKLISVDCINRLGNYRAYYSTGFGGVSSMPVKCSMNLSMFKRCENDTFENVQQNFRIFSEACGFPLEHISLHREVHAPGMCTVTAADIPADIFDRSAYGEADGQVTADPSVALFVYAGDCCTIMLVDPVHEVSGTTHCGWRNSVNGTIPAFIAAFESCGGVVEQSVAVLGPSICRNHYNVSEEAANQFISLGFASELGDRDAQNRYPIDLPEINRKLLMRQGLQASQIHVMPWCTWEAEDLRLPSYRRDHALNGMLGGVLYHV